MCIRDSPVGNAIVSDDVIELCSRLIVPRAPRLAAIHRYRRALIDTEQHHFGTIGIYPDAMVVIAAGRSFYRHPRLSAIDGFVRSNVGHKCDIGILRVNANLRKIPWPAGKSFIRGYESPALTGVVRSICAGLLPRIDDRVHPLSVTRRN